MKQFLRDNLEDYLQDRLTDRDRAEFESYMATIPGDCDMVRKMQSISASFDAFDLPSDTNQRPSPGFYAGVMRQVAEQRGQPLWNFFLDPLVMRRIAYASCVWLLLLVAADFYQSSAQTATPYQPSRLTASYLRAGEPSGPEDHLRMILCNSPETDAYCNVRFGPDLETNRSLMLAAVMVSGRGRR